MSPKVTNQQLAVWLQCLDLKLKLGPSINKHQRTHLHDAVNSWLPKVNMVVPSPITVVIAISFSCILSSSTTTISIFGLLFPGKLTHCSVSLIKSLIPSPVKLPTSRRSTKSFRLNLDSTFTSFKKMLKNKAMEASHCASCLKWKGLLNQSSMIQILGWVWTFLFKIM